MALDTGSFMGKKVLVIRFSSIGDIVLTTPVLRSLKSSGHSVHFLTKKTFATILTANPNVDKVIVINRLVSEQIEVLKKEQYDHIIDLHGNLRSLKVKFKLRASRSTFHKLNFQKWLLTRVKINILPKIHIVERYCKVLESLGLSCDRDGLDYFIPSQEKIEITQYIPAPQKYICIALGAAHHTKQIPTEILVPLIDIIPYPVILIGGPNDSPKARSIISLTKHSHCISLCGQLSIHQSASVIDQSIGIITPDTGMMHIAAALQKSLVAIWGNTVPEFGMYPYYGSRTSTKYISLENIISCRPCSKIGYVSCPKNHFKCMMLHQPIKIWNAMESLIPAD